MGLTARKSLRLEDAGLDKLFVKHEAMWIRMAQEAYDYTIGPLQGANEPVRRDDLIPVLVPLLEVTDTLRTYLSENKLRQNYWFTWFGELIIDRVWNDIADDDQEADE